MTVKQILYSLQNCSLGQSAARAPTPATSHHPKFPHKMRRRHLESVSAAPYGRCFCIVRIQPQLSGKGVLGHSPKRILVPFVRIKGTPRRRAAQTLHPAKSTRRRQATTNLAPAGQAYSLCLCKRLRAADRRDEMIALIFAVNPSVSLAADSFPYTGEPVV